MDVNEIKKKVTDAVDKLNEAIKLAADNKIGVIIFDIKMIETAQLNMFQVEFSENFNKRAENGESN